MTAWKAEGACLGTDPNIWFPVRGGATDHLKAVCAGCPVRQECAEYAITNEPQGIWGGLSGRQRDRIRVERGWLRFSNGGNHFNPERNQAKRRVA